MARNKSLENGATIRSALLMVALCVATTSALGESIRIKVTHGARNAICKEVAEVFRKAPPDELREAWHKYFSDVEWKIASYPSIGADGRNYDNQFRYTSVDIDNDGTEDLVILETTFFTSILWDHLYKTSAAEFAKAQKEGTFQELIGTAKPLDFSNGVIFSNGFDTVPVELHVWRRGKETLLLMMENFFASPEVDLPNAVLVGRLKRSSNASARKFGTLTPDLVCRITATPEG